MFRKHILTDENNKFCDSGLNLKHQLFRVENIEAGKTLVIRSSLIFKSRIQSRLVLWWTLILKCPDTNTLLKRLKSSNNNREHHNYHFEALC
jgi:hypothetical protein